jgi:hypothetical protein
MSCNKQARARLVEIATKDAALWQRDLWRRPGGLYGIARPVAR